MCCNRLPLVKKLPARKNELLHAFFRDDSLARTKGEPIAMWLVRYNEQLGKLNRVGLDIVPGAQTSENVSHEIRVLIIAGDSPDPHLLQREHF